MTSNILSFVAGVIIGMIGIIMWAMCMNSKSKDSNQEGGEHE